MNYGKLTAGTTKTAIDTAKPSEMGEIITYLSRMGDVLKQLCHKLLRKATPLNANNRHSRRFGYGNLSVDRYAESPVKPRCRERISSLRNVR